MYGYPTRDGARLGPARILGDRVLRALEHAPVARLLAPLGALGRARGQRTIVFGGVLRDLALGLGGPPRAAGLAVTGDPLAFAAAAARVLGARWEPAEHGRGIVARVRAPEGLGLEVSGYAGGILPFLATRDFTCEGLAFDLTEPTRVLDAWGGLEDAARRRLVPSGSRDPSLEPLLALRGAVLARLHGLDPSPRLSVAEPALADPGVLADLAPEDFWEAVDPLLVPGGAPAFGDRVLGRVLDAWVAARGLAGTPGDDRARLAAVDGLEAALATRQVAEAGLRSGAGLSALVRLLVLLAGRGLPEGGLHGPEAVRTCLVALGRSPALATAAARVAAGAGALRRTGFPYRDTPAPPEGPLDPGAAGAALYAAALALLEPVPGDVARGPRDAVGALARRLGPRVARPRPRAA